MDIKIEAPKHANQESMQEYYNHVLTGKYAQYDFIKSMDVKVKMEKDGSYHVALQTKPEKSKMIYAAHEDDKENRALHGAIKKLNTQIEKYKEVHYHKRENKDSYNF